MMRDIRMRMMTALLVIFSTGCGASAQIEPGHRGLVFNPYRGGLHDQVLMPGRYLLPPDAQMEDFDVTYTTRREHIHALTSEGLPIDAEMAIIYRPVIAELYALDTEIGQNYYDELIGPEFRSASRACFAAHSISDLRDVKSVLEDEVEGNLRRRLVAKHIEIAAVTLEGVQLPPAIVNAIRDRTAAAESEKQKREIEAK
jgi:regulator of protease activity HflC (stomatin/prohibitin superfamily)